jgi:hypothetical protein
MLRWLFILVTVAVVVGPLRAVDCPKFRGCPNPRLDNGDCAIDAEWFVEYNGCTGPHGPIEIYQNQRLVLYESKGRQFTVGDFKQLPTVGAVCQPDGTRTPAPNAWVEDNSTVTPSASVFHVLYPLGDVGTCYAVNFVFADGLTPVDPHVVIKGASPSVFKKCLPSKPKPKPH